MQAFRREDVLPSWFMNSIQRFLGGTGGFQLTLQDSTHVQVTAGAEEDAAVVSIEGLWRWVEESVSRAHPGGAAGDYDIFVVATANRIVSRPAAGTDETDYSFELRILASGRTPTIEEGVVDVFRLVGSCQWDGAAITRVDQTWPAVPTHAHRHALGQPDPIVPSDIGTVSSGWGEPSPPGGSKKTVLTYAATMADLVDEIETLKLALLRFGVLSA